MRHFLILFLLSASIVVGTEAFAELQPSGNALAISTPFNSYVSGDKVFVYVDTNPNSNVTISVISPSLDIVERFFTTSDEDGRIRTTFFLPVDSEQGAWIMNATHGVNFDTVEFEVVDLQQDRMIMDIVSLEKYRPISEPFDYSDHVLVGTILQKENATENTLRYSIDVDFYLKNEQSFDLITATLDKPEKPTHSNPVAAGFLQINGPFFDQDDLVFVYLKNSNGEYEILPQSFVIETGGWFATSGISPTSPYGGIYDHGKEIVFSGVVPKAELYEAARKDRQFILSLTISDEDGKTVVSEPLNIDTSGRYEYRFDAAKNPPGNYSYEIEFRGGISGSTWHDTISIEPSLRYWTPLKQFKMGMAPSEIECRYDMVLVAKSDDSPACVTPATKQRLIERGWASVKTSQTDNEFGGLTKYQEQTINLGKLTCAKTVNPQECRQDLEERKEFFRDKNLMDPTNFFTAIITDLEEHYSEKEPIVFSTYINSNGNDCVTLITRLVETKTHNYDELTVRNICFKDPKDDRHAFEDEYRFNTPEKIRILEKGEYRIELVAHYYHTDKVLVAEEFVIS